MKIKFQFSKKVSIICLILILGMLRASYWQWERHLQKKAEIEVLEKRIEQAVEPINKYLDQDTNWKDMTYRRLSISGKYDYANEIAINNRKYENQPGKHVITPLKIKGTEKYILIDRGFIPLSDSSLEKRKKFQKPSEETFIGLIKPPLQRKFFLQPADPEPVPGKKFDSWYRVDIEKINIQLGYKTLEIYAEKFPLDKTNLSEKLISSSGDKAEILVLPGANDRVAMPGLDPNLTYPVPDPNKVIPPGRHLGYVYEWAFMALLTFLAGVILQLKKN